MANQAQSFELVLPRNLSAAKLILMFTCALLLMPRPAVSQTFSVLHTFTGGVDGGNPAAGLTYDSSGLFYGTTFNWGSSLACTNGCGVAFELRARNSQWIVSPLYEFNGTNGAKPLAGIAEFNGIPYGTTSAGGSGTDGTVYELRPQPTPCRTSRCYWNQTLLHSFTGVPDGANPAYGNVVFDSAGNVYGTASNGGAFGCGTVWKLARSGAGWTDSVLYSFRNGNDGCDPQSGVIFDAAGNLYGTTWDAGSGGVGTVFELSPQNGGWVKTILYNFPNGDGRPFGTPIMDPSGNLYGTTFGSVYELSPVNGGWNFSIVYAFNFCELNAGVTLGPDGDLYGVCKGQGVQSGSVFELPPNCNGTCRPNYLHSFSFTDGSLPTGPVVFDANGNLYGTTFYGGYTGAPCGAYGCGVIWEIAGAADVPRH